jgi:hypothetical protein
VELDFTAVTAARCTTAQPCAQVEQASQALGIGPTDGLYQIVPQNSLEKTTGTGSVDYVVNETPAEVARHPKIFHLFLNHFSTC